jgi:uncharacterized repeat protein (TIGR01451 family)
VVLSTPNPTGTGTAANLLDETEETQWEVVDMGANIDVAQPFVTVDLVGSDPKVIRFFKLSAVAEVGRTSSLRRFRLESCNATLGPCLPAGPVGWTTIYESGPNTAPGCPVDGFCPESQGGLFPAQSFRPVAPNQILRMFDVALDKEIAATHVRLTALDNQCTGEPRYQGDQENDPTTPTTDCSESATTRDDLRMSELQVHEFDTTTRAPGDPLVAFTKIGPRTAARGTTITYNLSYTNLGPASVSSPKVTDTLPASLSFVSATGGGTYNPSTRTVTWNPATVPLGTTGTLTVTARVSPTAPVGSTIINKAQFTAPLTIAPPAAAITVVT